MATWLIIIANILIFLYESSLPDKALAELIHRYSFIPSRFLDSLSHQGILAPETYIPIFSSMFLHGSWMHVISNMWSLWLFGDNVEDRMGSMRFIIFYIICGLIAAFSHFLSNPMSTVPTVGASGAIAGIMGAYFVLFPHARIITLILVLVFPLFIRIPAVIFLFIWFISQLYSGIVQYIAGSAVGGIAWWAHIFGFLGGMWLYRFFIKRKNYRYFWDDDYRPW